MIALQYLNETIFFSLSLPSKFISDTYELRGLIKMHLNQHMESIIDFNKAINFSPKNALLFFYRYSCYLVLSKYDAAIKDCEKLIKFHLLPHIAIKEKQLREKN